MSDSSRFYVVDYDVTTMLAYVTYVYHVSSDMQWKLS